MILSHFLVLFLEEVLSLDQVANIVHVGLAKVLQLLERVFELVPRVHTRKADVPVLKLSKIFHELSLTPVGHLGHQVVEFHLLYFAQDVLIAVYHPLLLSVVVNSPEFLSRS